MQRKIELKPGFVTERIEEYNKTAKDEEKIVVTGNQSKPVGMYRFYLRHKDTIYCSGFGSRTDKGEPINGHLNSNDEKMVAQGQTAAKGACLNLINNLAMACRGDLDGVTGINIDVDENSSSEFKKHPPVADGASKLLKQIFGNEIGLPARKAAGPASLPNGMMVEIKATITITKKLAGTLDLQDAKDIATRLYLLEIITKNAFDKISAMDTLGIKQKCYLELVINMVLPQIKMIPDEVFNKQLNAVKNNELLQDITSKNHFFDVILASALRLDLNVNPLSGNKVTGVNQRPSQELQSKL